MPRGQSVTEHVGDEVQVRGAVHLGDDQGVEIGRLEHGGEVGESQARGHGVDADAELGDVGWARLREEGEDVLPRGGLLGGRDGVFEVIGYAVHGDAAGFLEESRGGGWDWAGLEVRG